MKDLNPEILNQLIEAYKGLPAFDRFHIKKRLTRNPFEKINRFVPTKGKIFDYGCGHGMFSYYLWLSSPQRTILGYDISEKKIRLAKGIPAVSQKLELTTRPDEWMQGGPYDCIFFMDVFYLIPFAEQEKLLKLFHELLNPDGQLLFVETAKAVSPRFLKIYLQEILAVRLFKITRTNTPQGFYYRRVEEWLEILTRIGFTPRCHPYRQGIHLYQALK
jgi:2-polyprenyl-3-methyl-5-hydroxy-6-metoxy-1,4-benzoquinol methylase